mgnify:CR=1 FL=1|tara:strand:- start:1702 stop:2085 length:384 start_codon:yes stop_codon:yes gene_type:complete
MSIIQVPMHIIDAAAGTATNRYLAFGERYNLNSVKIINNGTVPADNSNYATITVYGSNGSTAAFSWDTRAANQGALTDATSGNLADQSSGLTNYSAGTAIKLAITKAGSGQALDSMMLFEFESARSY